jgi:hypothetical protein
MGLFLAGLLAAVTVLVAEQFDTSFHSADELRQFTRLPVLATIPRLYQAPGLRWARAAVIAASLLAGFALLGTLSAHMARDNEPLVRLLARGG